MKKLIAGEYYEMSMQASDSGDDLFLTVNGERVAKRGRPGTPEAKTWVPLDPRIEIIQEGDEIEVRFLNDTTH